MSLLSVAHQAPARSRPATSALRALVNGFIVWRTRRARRVAMLSLLDMDPTRLDDLGISLDAVRDALEARH